MAIFHHLGTKVFKSETPTFHYFSPRVLISKHFDIGFWELGAKGHLSGTDKKWTDTQTDTHTHRWRNQLIERLGPEG